MKEIEIKILNINVRAIAEKLKKLGAKRIGKFLVISKAFDFPDGRITKRGDVLRVRSIGKNIEVGYKTKSKETRFKVNEETETAVGNFAAMEEIFHCAGLKAVRHHEKYRTSFILNNVQCEIEEYPNIPPYMEIEGPKKAILKTTQLLGIPKASINAFTAEEVMKKYGVDNKIVKFSPDSRQ